MRTTEQGPISTAIGGRPPFGPMAQLDHDQPVKGQREPLRSARRRYSLSARLLSAIMDAVYGRERTLEKFRVRELGARVPYQAWGNRWEQDNEQWHLLTLEELVAPAPRRPWVRSRVLRQILAFAYYELSWFMFAIQPAWSYRLNADFEDHAEHEHAHLVERHPESQSTPYDGAFTADFTSYASLAGPFRQIGYDERLHKVESELRMRRTRFE